MICKLKLLISINKHLYRGMYEYIGFFQLRILTQDKRVRITPILYIHWFVIADSPTYVWHFVNENVKTGKPLRQKKRYLLYQSCAENSVFLHVHTTRMQCTHDIKFNFWHNSNNI